jgi:hypothetical protein
MNAEIVLSPAPELQAAKRVLEIFTVQINSDRTANRALNASRRFAERCDARAAGRLGGEAAREGDLGHNRRDRRVGRRERLSQVGAQALPPAGRPVGG